MKTLARLLHTRVARPRNLNGEVGTFQFAHGVARASRISLCNHLIVSQGFESYLEIGTRNRRDMNDHVLAKHRASIDPDPAAQADYVMTSDAYFDAHQHRFDLIFIDGLHTGEQVRRDIDNSLNALRPGGMVLLHDMNPPTAQHAREVYEIDGTFPAWNGTSWEEFAWHRKNRPDLDICVVDTDWGVGVIQAGRQTLWDGETAGYEALQANRKALLNLISVPEFLRRYPAR